MSCCGSTRRHAAATLTAAAPATPPLPAARATLLYTGKPVLTVRGPFSGRLYRLDPARRRIDADPADLAALVRTGLFDTL